MKTITGNMVAWLSSSHINDNPGEVENLSFSSHDMSDCGWTNVGNAVITVELFDDQEIKAGMLATLDEAEKRVKADAQNKLTEIERQRQQLLAIEYKP